ncbi:ABC transporter permease [Lapillicoccus jejuensis]|uniref:Putative ABC transport system permease protein n=1 Tax=Lapillicoccus jejuensis TaxID=402171 RepID=A0A542DZR3_9MICO|nr:ABC transporter permease [Lapillicoccus jejuensis]TQJ08578.1 putative ABC transport system permease protein [Lapillicoccus jejuensis]
MTSRRGARPAGADWRASWRLALRMGRRDVRRHRGRSLLIGVLVLLPVAALVVVSTLAATSSLSADERLALDTGSAGAALVLDHDATEPLPGWSTGHEAQAVRRLLGGRVTVVSSGQVTARQGRRDVPVDVLGVDGAVDAHGRAALTSGRWPRTADEVLVTPVGRQAGLPESGSLTVRTGADATRTLTVVGTGTGLVVFGSVNLGPAGLVALPSVGPGALAPQSGSAAPELLLTRDHAVTVAERTRLDAAGLRVLDRQDGSAPPRTSGDASDPSTLALWTGVGSTILLLLTGLLAGPAFAIGAIRQRHALALLAVTGATTRQLRRTVLGQALVLGVLGAGTGGALGLGVSAALVATLRARDPRAWWQPYDVPWPAILVALTLAVAGSVVSALLPARGLGRLDVVRVLRGQLVSPRLHRGLPVVGLVLLVPGTVGLCLAAARSETGGTDSTTITLLVVGGTVLLLLGALGVIPGLLVLTGRLLRGAPVAVRMAVRDAARQRGRATPTVLAVCVVSAALCAVAVLAASSTEHDRRSYVPRFADGAGQVLAGPDDTTWDTAAGRADLAALVREVDPHLRLLDLGTVSTDPGVTQGRPGTPTRLVVGLRPGCSAAQAAAALDPMSSAPVPGCLAPASLPGAEHGGIAVVDATYAARVLGLDEASARLLAQGGLVAADGDGRPAGPIATGPGEPAMIGSGDAALPVVDGGVLVADGPLRTAPASATGEPLPTVFAGTPRLVRLAAASAPRARFAALAGSGAVVTPETAARFGWSHPAGASLVVDDRGPMDAATEAALGAALDRASPGARIDVERGYDASSNGLATSIVLLVAGFLVLVATLVATGLSQAEAEPLGLTMSAVGATRGTRRRLAAAQAATLSLVGMLFGVALGLAPGVVMALSATTPREGDTLPVPSVVVVPWPTLSLVLVLVPTLAALVALATVRRDVGAAPRVA